MRVLMVEAERAPRAGHKLTARGESASYDNTALGALRHISHDHSSTAQPDWRDGDEGRTAPNRAAWFAAAAGQEAEVAYRRQR